MHWILCFLVFVASLEAGEIFTTSDFARIEEVVENLDCHSIVLFDVDATLIVPDDAILRPQGKDLFELLIDGHDDRDLFRDIRLQASHSLVDARSTSLVQRLQKRKVPVIAYTAAPAKIRGMHQLGNWRIDELKSHGFDFSCSFADCKVLELPKSTGQSHFPMFKSGVLFSSFHPKGDVLILFLQKMGLNPKRIIFVDDELRHVQSVVKSLERHGIACLGIHYTAAIEAPCELNPEQAAFQVNYFINKDVWLSDIESRNYQNISNLDFNPPLSPQACVSLVECH